MGPEGRGAELGEALAQLRESGSALLVAGTVPDRLHQQACDELFGTGAGERLFVRVGTGAGAAVDPADTDRVVELDAVARGAAAADASDGGGGAVASESGSGAVAVTPTLSTAADAIEEALAALDTGPDQGPRVCVDALLPLLETAGEEQTFRFLHQVTGRVRRLGGTCHVHLSLPTDDATVRTLSALADATVELRLADDRAEQRWLLHGDGLRSDWLAFPTE